MNRQSQFSQQQQQQLMMQQQQARSMAAGGPPGAAQQVAGGQQQFKYIPRQNVAGANPHAQQYQYQQPLQPYSVRELAANKFFVRRFRFRTNLVKKGKKKGKTLIRWL